MKDNQSQQFLVLMWSLLFIVALATSSQQLSFNKTLAIKKNKSVQPKGENVQSDHKPQIYVRPQASDGDFPYIVFMLCAHSVDFDLITSCSATLVSPNWIVTAAHCTEDNYVIPGGVFLVAGKSNVNNYLIERMRTPFFTPVDEIALGLQERRSAKIAIHPKYNIPDGSYMYDIALHKLNNPFVPSTKVSTLPISKGTMKTHLCTVFSWGYIEGGEPSYILSYTSKKVSKRTTNKCTYKTKGLFICLEGESVEENCQHDAGSPIICNNQVMGIASHASCMGLCSYCGNYLEKYYSEIYPVIKWTNNVMEKNWATSHSSPFVPIIIIYLLKVFFV